jgi:hypothetical protein
MRAIVLLATLALPGQQALTDQAILSGSVYLHGTSTPIQNVRLSLTRLHPDLPQTPAALDVAQNVAYLMLSPEASSPAYIDGFLFGAAARAGAPVESLRPLSATSAVTDESGKFSFSDLSPGRYALAARREGYFNADPGALNTTMVGRTITIEVGKQPPRLDLFMTQGGIVSGRVRDPQGQPVANVTVAAYRPSYPNGVLAWTSVLSRTSDDRGEYRLFPLPAGQYFIGAIPATAAVIAGVQDSWLRTFYPGTIDPAAAVALTTGGGMEIPGVNIDIRASNARTYKISGTAVNPLPSVPPNAAGVVDRSVSSFYLVPRSSSILDSSPFPAAVPNAIPVGSRGNGEFEIRNVKPGPYDLYTAYLDGNIGRYFTSRTPVDVLDRDVTGLSIAITPGGTLDVEVVVEGNAEPPIKIESLQLEFATMDTTPGMFARFNSGQALGDKGKVVLANIVEARYRLSLRGLPQTAYLADIRQSGQSVFDEGVVIGQQIEPVRIAVSTAGGAVIGLVQKSNRPAAGATVILIPPTGRRKNSQLFKTTTTGEDGRFSMSGIMPGPYTILALQNRPSGEPWLNADFLATYLQSGSAVRVEAREASEARLELITD